jgi:hypothetical protein
LAKNSMIAGGDALARQRSPRFGFKRRVEVVPVETDSPPDPPPPPKSPPAAPTRETPSILDLLRAVAAGPSIDDMEFPALEFDTAPSEPELFQDAVTIDTFAFGQDDDLLFGLW